MRENRRLVRGIAVIAFGLLLSGVAFANGDGFFGDKDLKLDLYYFGDIRDQNGVRLDNAVVTIVAKNANMKFPFRNDAPGHYRSPDIGKAVKGLGKKVDPSQLTITVQKKGYVMVKVDPIPNKTEGGIEIDVWMQPAPSTVAAN